ncbi:MAG TPA: hypothetical protein VFF67_10205 [Thermoplasmata archaeon]|nr:hypothetical protein [Thermoplasmata archaeon]
MILGPGEKVLLREVTKSFGPPERLGNLYLTNQRLVYEAEIRGGLLGSTTRIETSLNARLHEVANVHALPRGLVGPTLQVDLAYGTYRFRVGHAAPWAHEIVNAKGQAPPPPPRFVPPPPPPPPGQLYPPAAGHASAPLVVNFVAPAAPLPQLHCRYCGALSPGGSRRCTGCGAAL